MRVVIQRVTRAEVRSDGSVLGRIDRGAMVLAGIAEGDTATLVTRMADKVAGPPTVRGPGLATPTSMWPMSVDRCWWSASSRCSPMRAGTAAVVRRSRSARRRPLP